MIYESQLAMNTKLEKMYYKLTTILSDINIEKEFNQNQFKKLSQEKEELSKSFKTISLILGIQAEAINLLNSMSMQNEI